MPRHTNTTVCADDVITAKCSNSTSGPVGHSNVPAGLSSRGLPPPQTPAVRAQIKCRGWCFTFNNYTEADEQRIKGIACNYIVFGREEAPETHTKHLQGYVYFDTQRYFNGVKTMIGGNPHIEAAKGNKWQNRVYCTKTEDFWESGDVPKEPAKERSERNKKRYADAVELAKTGKVAEIEPELLAKHLSNFMKMSALTSHQKSLINWSDENMHGHFFWIYGETGTGKSHVARNMCDRIAPGREPYLKSWSKWWDAYTPGDVIIIDEATPENCKYLAGYFKQWIDKWSFRAEIKGGHTANIRPEWIIVTSNYSIEDCFPNDKDYLPLQRRLNTVLLNERDDTLLDRLLPLAQLGIGGNTCPDSSEPEPDQIR